MKNILTVLLIMIGYLSSGVAYTIEDKLSFFDQEKIDMRQKIDTEMSSIIGFYTKLGIVDSNATKKLETLNIILSSDITMLADGRIGEYNSKTNSMTLNSNTLSSFNVLRFKDTLSHEMLHLLQFANNEFIIKDKLNKTQLFRLEGEAQFFSYLYLLSQNIPKSSLEAEVIIRKTPSYKEAFKFYLNTYQDRYWKIYIQKQ